MVFKRRDKRPWPVALRETLWPRGGWSRAFHYVRHRLNRLPDQPHRIARGIFAGVFVSFTPLFGVHLLLAAGLAKLARGNIIAALFGTLIGNPVTFPLIALSSIKLGHWMLGSHFEPSHAVGLLATFSDAFDDLRHNVVALFTHAHPRWEGLLGFFDEIFLPYLVGGAIPGLIAGFISYHIALPIVTAYQNRRRTRLKERLAKLRAKLPSRPKPPAEGEGPMPPPGPDG